MKRLMSAVLSMVIVLMMCGGALAEEFHAQGSALVNLFAYNTSTTNHFQTDIILSNITSNLLKCKVTVYDHDGNDITNLGKVYTGSTSQQFPTVASSQGEFEIPSHSSRMFILNLSGAIRSTIGYAVIEWATNDDIKLRKALIGEVFTAGVSGIGIGIGGMYTINNGNPF